MPGKSLYPDKPQKPSQGGPNSSGYGLVHLCYGTGAGKTSRCIGLAVRAAGAGLRVTWVQFMKSGDSSEVAVLRQIPGIAFFCPGHHPFITPAGPQDVHFSHAAQALAQAHQALQDGAQVLICDELLNTVLFGLLSNAQLLDLMSAARGRCELMLSGAAADPSLIEAADYATELVMRKHPYYQGIPARKGVEF